MNWRCDLRKITSLMRLDEGEAKAKIAWAVMGGENMGEWMQTYMSPSDGVGDAVQSVGRAIWKGRMALDEAAPCGVWRSLMGRPS